MGTKIGRALLRQTLVSEKPRTLVVAGGRIKLTDKQVDAIETMATEEAHSAPNPRAREAVYRASKSLLEMQVVGIDPAPHEEEQELA